jgi:antitoxin component of MazEF toxin-antitoxin module
MSNNTEIRKVQANHSLSLVIPRSHATSIGIEKGNFIKISLDNNRIILEKVMG